jgi:hypothetical protein
MPLQGAHAAVVDPAHELRGGAIGAPDRVQDRSRRGDWVTDEMAIMQEEIFGPIPAGGCLR